jgi:hypothetical protein
MTAINAGGWPTGRVATRHQMPDGRIVQVDINWHLIYWLARKSLTNKTQRSSSGPVLVRVVK